MINGIFLFLFIGIACFFLWLGISKKQYLAIIIGSMIYIVTSLFTYSGIELRSQLNHTVQENISDNITTSYFYFSSLIDSTYSNTLALLFLLIGVAFLFIGLYFFYKNPDFSDSGDSEE